MNDLITNKMTLSVMEVASILQISRGMAYQLVKRKDFPKLRIGKRIIIPRDGLIDWLKEQTEGEKNDF